MNTLKNALILSCRDDILQKSITNIPDKYFSMDEEELEKIANPTPRQRHLKIVAQAEITRAVAEERPLSQMNMCRGVMHINNFEKAIKDPVFLAWLLVPNIAVEVKSRLIYEHGLERLKDIMDIIYKRFEETKKLEFAREFHNIFKTIASRAAPIVTRQEVKMQTVPTEPREEMKDVEERIKQLEQELGKDKSRAITLSGTVRTRKRTRNPEE